MLQPLEMGCAQKLMSQKLSGQLSKNKILLTETNLKELGGVCLKVFSLTNNKWIYTYPLTLTLCVTLKKKRRKLMQSSRL